MTTLIITVHVIVSLVLIVVILLQSGSTGGMGAAFGGGGSQSLFGSSGSGKFFTRLTAIVAGIFMITSISLTIMSAHRAKGTVMDSYTPPAVSQPAPAETLPTAPASAPMPVAAEPAPEKSGK
ncbi:MAG: preprotein translocase subunit SecG [Deltaproteobacteria bacterium]|nr:preprotein translocase subunit SecG [Deltaproteobacteria bacterium]